MNIIFFVKGNKAVKIRLGIAGSVVVAALLGLAGWGVFTAGYKRAVAETEYIVHTVRSQTGPDWQAEMRQELDASRRLRAEAENSLTAMASRLSLMQGHVMRLDALGSRLADLTEVVEMDFDLATPPGMGGPEPAADAEPPRPPDVLLAMAHVEEALLDRQDKLLILESMLIDQKLRERTSPAGVPAQQKVWLSSHYGHRSDPVTGNRHFHKGVDYAGKEGTPILAVADGIVTSSGSRYGYGNMVEINHGNGLVTRYGHNLKNMVSVGDIIERGQVIGQMGSSGRSTGPHVHFEVLQDGKHINPKQFLPD